MKKELKFNIVIVIILIIMDFVGEKIFNMDVDSKEFEYPFVLLKVIYNFCFFGIYIINYLCFAPLFLAKKKYVYYGFSFLFMIALFMGMRYLLDEVIYFKISGHHNYNLEYSFLKRYVLDAFFIVLKASMYSSAIFLFFRFIKNKDEMHQLEIENRRAQLAVLKGQISPHFLFNTLNTFYSELYDTKPETADGIMKLSELLRYVTYESDKEFMLLRKEIRFIKDYLYFFEKRLEHHFCVILRLKGLVKGQQIPSLLLIHFVENLCKHGVINNKDYPAEIKIMVTDKSLEIETKNTINTAEKYMESGIGTSNIKKRLDVLFKDDYILKSTQIENRYTAYLKIPLC